jgi:hypothetical protein
MKKLLILSIAFLFSIIMNSQTKLDSLVLIKINNYRSTVNLNPIKFDTCAWKAGNSHNQYMINLIGGDTYIAISHSEHKGDSYPFTGRVPSTRVEYFSHKPCEAFECMCLYGVNTDLDTLSSDLCKALVNYCVYNGILINSDVKFGAVSCMEYTNKSGVCILVIIK